MIAVITIENISKSVKRIRWNLFILNLKNNFFLKIIKGMSNIIEDIIMEVVRFFIIRKIKNTIHVPVNKPRI